jgi:putative lipoprotein
MPALLRARRPFRRPGSLLAVALLLAPPSARAEDRWTGPDKALHLGVSAALASAGYGVSSLELERPGRFAVGGAVALGAGIDKEVWDLSGGGDASWRDLVADVAGTALGLAVAFGVDLLVASLSATPAS